MCHSYSTTNVLPIHLYRVLDKSCFGKYTVYMYMEMHTWKLNIFLSGIIYSHNQAHLTDFGCLWYCKTHEVLVCFIVCIMSRFYMYLHVEHLITHGQQCSSKQTIEILLCAFWLYSRSLTLKAVLVIQCRVIPDFQHRLLSNDTHVSSWKHISFHSRIKAWTHFAVLTWLIWTQH